MNDNPNDKPNLIKTWWHTRNEKTQACCFLGLIVSACVILGICFYFFSDPITICKTPTCYSASSEILNYINVNERPYKDFYRFACGRFQQNKSLDDPYSFQSVQLTMQDELLHEMKLLLEERIDPQDLCCKKILQSLYERASCRKSWLDITLFQTE